MNRPGGTRPNSNLTKSEGILTEERSSTRSSEGGDINMDGTRYCLCSPSDTQEQSRLNLTINAIRVPQVSLLYISIKDFHS